MYIRILAGYLGRKYSGSAAYHFNLAKHLLRKGHKVSVICYGGETNNLNVSEMIVLPEYFPPRIFWRFQFFLRYLHYMKNLSSLDLSAPDITIAGEHLLMRAHYKQFPRIPWLYLPHSYTVANEITSYSMDRFQQWCGIKLYESLQRWALNTTTTIRFTELGCRVLSDHYGRKIHSNFVINPIGVNLPNINKQKTKDQKISYPIKFLFVGRLVKSKDVAELLRTMSAIVKEKWLLDIVGDGNQKEYLINLSKELGISESVRFHGYQERPEKWYEKADVFVSMSILENFPITYLESMSYGVPVISMRCDGIRYLNTTHEYIKQDVNGFLAENRMQFRNIVEKICAKPNLLYEIANNARTTIEEKYTWEKHIERYERIFLKMKKTE